MTHRLWPIRRGQWRRWWWGRVRRDPIATWRPRHPESRNSSDVRFRYTEAFLYLHVQVCLIKAWNTWSQSYQTLIFPVVRFLVLSFRVCSIWKKFVYCTKAKLSSKKRKNSSFPKKKSLVGLTPEHGKCRRTNE